MLPNGIIKTTPLRNQNSPIMDLITKMGVAHAFEHEAIYFIMTKWQIISIWPVHELQVCKAVPIEFATSKCHYFFKFGNGYLFLFRLLS